MASVSLNLTSFNTTGLNLTPSIPIIDTTTTQGAKSSPHKTNRIGTTVLQPSRERKALDLESLPRSLRSRVVRRDLKTEERRLPFYQRPLSYYTDQVWQYLGYPSASHQRMVRQIKARERSYPISDRSADQSAIRPASGFSSEGSYLETLQKELISCQDRTSTLEQEFSQLKETLVKSRLDLENLQKRVGELKGVDSRLKQELEQVRSAVLELEKNYLP